MSDQQQTSQPKRYTRLRDFGAFTPDVAELDTHKVISIPVWQREQSLLSSLYGEESSLVDSDAYTVVQPDSLLADASTIVHLPTTPLPPASLEEEDVVSAQPQRKPVSLQNVKRKKWLSVTLRVGVTVLLFGFLFKSLSWQMLLQSLVHVQTGKMLLGLIVGAFSVVVSSYQWRSLLRAERIEHDLAGLVDLYLVGIAFSHFLPTGMGGDVVKAIQVGRESGNNAGSASATLMSRITGFFGMLLLSLPVLLIWHSQFNSQVVLSFFLLSLLVGGMMCGTIGLAAVLPRLARGKWINHKIFASALKIGNALKAATQRPRVVAIAIVYGIEFWIVGCLNYYAYGVALRIHIPLYYYFIAIPFVSLVTFLPISINGFGVREGAFVFVFSTMHVNSATSLLLALFMDAQVLLFGLVGGCIYFMMGYKNKADEKKVKERRTA